MMINAKRSYTEYTVTDPTTDFIIGFENFNSNNKDVIHVTLGGIDVTSLGYTVRRDSAIKLVVTPAITGGIVRLQRETLIDEPFHKFTAGALFTAKSMDENFAQTSHLQQEVKDGFAFVETNINSVAGEARAATVAALAVIPEVRAASTASINQNNTNTTAAILRTDNAIAANNTAANAAVLRSDTATSANTLAINAAVTRADDNNIKTATATTTEAGTQATAAITGTGATRKLAITIPKGDKGLKGDTGNSGALSSVTVATGAEGSNASVALSGTPEARVMALTIPRGSAGISGTVTGATVTMAAAGSTPTVTVGGTAQNRTLAFTLPQGANGAAGANGDRGDRGFDGAAGSNIIDEATGYGIKLWTGTIAQYNAISTKDYYTLYMVKA